MKIITYLVGLATSAVVEFSSDVLVVSSVFSLLSEVGTCE